MKYLLPLLFLVVMAMIILAGYWYEACQWRYCRCCGKFWHIKTGRKQSCLPRETEGIVKARSCPDCLKTIP
jgi:hypothetical protein